MYNSIKSNSDNWYECDCGNIEMFSDHYRKYIVTFEDLKTIKCKKCGKHLLPCSACFYFYKGGNCGQCPFEEGSHVN